MIRCAVCGARPECLARVADGGAVPVEHCPNGALFKGPGATPAA